MIYNFSGKGTKKNAQIQKKRAKVYFYAIFVVFRLRGVAVASRWASTLWYEVGVIEGTTLPLYVRTKSAHTQ